MSRAENHDMNDVINGNVSNSPEEVKHVFWLFRIGSKVSFVRIMCSIKESFFDNIVGRKKSSRHCVFSYFKCCFTSCTSDTSAIFNPHYQGH